MNVTVPRFAVFAALVVLATGFVHAQDARAPRQTGVDVIALDPITAGRPVLNAPFTAEATTEISQTLADGNRLEQRTTAKVARDSRGRIRREQRGIAVGSFVAQGAEPMVTITDPSTSSHIVLDFVQKIAFRSKLPPFKGTDLRAERQPVEKRAQASRTQGRSGSSTPRIEPAPFDDRAFDEEPLPDDPKQTATANTVRTQALETRTIGTLRAEGTRTITTIPANTVGNTRPLIVISEQWFSPDLKVVVLTRRADPRFGETVYRLINIERVEPAADLFAVPSGFKTEEVRASQVKLRPE